MTPIPSVPVQVQPYKQYNLQGTGTGTSIGMVRGEAPEGLEGVILDAQPVTGGGEAPPSSRLLTVRPCLLHHSVTQHLFRRGSSLCADTVSSAPAI